MSSLQRATLSIALAIAPMVGTGCVMTSPQRDSMRVTQRCELKMNTARLEENRGNLAQAKRIYLEIHNQYPQSAECSHCLALLCTRMNETNEADLYFRQAYAADPNNPDLLADMGYAAFLKKDFEQSEILLSRSVKLNGNDTNTINNLAIVQAWRQKDEASLTAFRRIHNEPDAIRHLAAIQFARGDKERGQFNYDLALQLDPTGAKAPLAIAQDNSSPSKLVPSEFSRSAPIISSPQAPLTSPLTAPVPPVAKTQPLSTAEEAIAWSEPVNDTISPQITMPPANPGAMLIDNLQSVEPPRLNEMTPAGIPPLTRRLIALSVQNVSVTAFSNSNLLCSMKGSVQVSEPPKREPVSEFKIPPAPTPSVPSVATAEEAAPNLKSWQQISIPSPPSVWRKTQQPRAVESDVAELVSLPSRSILQTSNSLDRIDDNLALKSICLVTLYEERRLTPSSSEFVVEYQSQQFRFSSVEAQDKFRADPKKYAPAAGGLDVVSVRNERSVVSGSLNFAVWYRHQLYLFSSSEHADMFRRNPTQYVSVE